ncbi:MAG: hypothetical protein CL944_00690 [Candidatus Diapherotrites archaeon]|uniref:DUF92 domain-containing protein n=1 Tax=Candidatus Iainarchaeum sp. TaxID=3101447 RepID=A0A2D6LP72_9ARCH|nr:hypothetical protein [Candidatus Diapherotrites archaeon]|tara:strand:- start:17392 stop:18081 length:690 start_codon:yes stop_codon:yes gene_type:complete
MLDAFLPAITTLNISVTILILAAFSFFSHRKKLINTTGIILADIIGIIAFIFGGFLAFLTLVIFYIIAETATKIAKKDLQKHEQRTTSNIIGNSGAAIIALFLGQGIAFFGAISAALADTVSSEIGMLSKKDPVLITSFKKVEKGTDGGITTLGTLAGLGAAILIGTLYYFTISPNGAIAIVIAGILGTLIDSLLGATLERKGILNNTQVNFLASGSGAILAFLLSGIV